MHKSCLSSISWFRRWSSLAVFLCIGLVAAGAQLALAAPALATAYYSGATTTLATSSNTPRSNQYVAVDSSGDVFVGGLYMPSAGPPQYASVQEIKAVNGQIPANPTITTLWNSPANDLDPVLSGLAVNASGDVFFSYDQTLNELAAVNGQVPTGATPTLVNTSGISFIASLAFDRNGDLFFSTYDPPVAAVIYEIPAVNGQIPASPPTPTAVVSNLPDTSLGGIAVDASGNIFYTDNYSNLYEIRAGTQNISTVYSGFTYAGGVAVGASGDVFVADDGNGTVSEFAATNGGVSFSSPRTVGSGFLSPFGLAVDGAGNVYVGDNDNGSVYEIALGVQNFGAVPVGSTSSLVDIPFTFTNTTGATLGGVQVLTEGAPGKDFAEASTGTTCNTTTSYSTSTTSSCEVAVQFTPAYAGQRLGAVQLLDAGGNVIATARLEGTGSGPQVVFPGETPISTGTGFTAPYGVAVDGASNVYVADDGSSSVNGEVYEMQSGCQSATCMKQLGTGFSGPTGVAVDGAGNVYVADYTGKEVYEMTPGCQSATCMTQLGSGFTAPSDVAVDGAGNVYVADANFSGTGEVYEMSPGCQSATCMKQLGGGFIAPVAVAVDGAGNVYVADYGNGSNGAVYEIPSGCTAKDYTNKLCTVTSLGGGLIAPDGVAVDGAGNVYVSDYGNGSDGEVYEMPPGCTSSTCVTSLDSGAFKGPNGVAVDANGDVYVSDWETGGVSEIVAAGCTANGTARSCTLIPLMYGFSGPAGMAMDGAGNVYVAASGSGSNRGVYELALATPPSMSFASTNVGATSNPVTVVLQNIGNETLTFPIPSTQGAYNPSVSTNFSYDNSSTCQQNGSGAASAFTLAPASTCTVAIDFSPTTAGTITGNAVLTDGNATTSYYTTQTIPLTGTGTETPVINWPPPASIPYGTALSSTQLDATASYNGNPVAGTFVYTPAAGTVLGVGTDTLSVTFTPTNTTEYTTATDSVSMTVTQAATTTSLTSSTSNANLNADVTFTATVTSTTIGTPTGAVEFLDGSTVLGTSQLNNNGVATYTTNTLTAGQHSITAVYEGDANFLESTSGALTQTVTAPDFGLTPNVTSITMKAGQTGTVLISLNPVGGFKGAVQFTCSGLPANSSCTFSPTSLTADGSNTTQTAQLNITTKGPNYGTVAMMTHPGNPDGIMMAGIFWLPGLLFGGFLLWQRKKLTQKYRVLLILLVVAATISGAVGCGSTTIHTAPGSSTVTVTATSGTTSHTATVSLQVTQ